MRCLQNFTPDVLDDPALLELIGIADRLIVTAKDLPENDKRNALEWVDDNREAVFWVIGNRLAKYRG